uniref:Transposase DDE domain protein n=1 Tax=Leptospira santarosai serovar Arenal str. MAVJ 401 TaxID=1049976 RepID=M6K1Z3_9LEPT|nr:hypothetical protein LEP1GSC063_3785 [Leptospira santarosai serovar Arenal str. MAVJ 401]
MGTPTLQTIERMRINQRFAIEPVISHLKHNHNMIRNFLKGKKSDRINPILLISTEIGTIHFESYLRFEAEFWTPGYIVLSSCFWV